MDANKDGKVTYEEETKYKLNHPDDAGKDKNSKTTTTQTDIKQLVGTIINAMA